MTKSAELNRRLPLVFRRALGSDLKAVGATCEYWVKCVHRLSDNQAWELYRSQPDLGWVRLGLYTTESKCIVAANAHHSEPTY